MMLNRKRRMKLVALMASGAMVFQFGGCLGHVWNNVGIGFGRALGAGIATPFGDIADLAGLFGDFLPDGGDGG